MGSRPHGALRLSSAELDHQTAEIVAFVRPRDLE